MATITRCATCHRAFRQPDTAEPIYGRDGRPLAGAAYYAAFRKRVEEYYKACEEHVCEEG